MLQHINTQRARAADARCIPFAVGRVTTTPGVRDALAMSGEVERKFIYMHSTGNFGDELPHAERAENQRNVRAQSGTVLSMYRTRRGARLWVATNEDRSSTRVFTPEEVGERGVFDEPEVPDALAA